MTTEDLVARLSALNASAAFNRWAGFEVVSAAPGRAELRMRWRDDGGQYAGFLHAGLIAALLDTVCGFAAFTQVGAVMASHFSVSCLAPAIGVAFVARGEVVKAGKRQIFTRAVLFAEDQTGACRPVATGETLLMPAQARPP